MFIYNHYLKGKNERENQKRVVSTTHRKCDSGNRRYGTFWLSCRTKPSIAFSERCSCVCDVLALLTNKRLNINWGPEYKL